jgi:hypothetical protein
MFSLLAFEVEEWGKNELEVYWEIGGMWVVKAKWRWVVDVVGRIELLRNLDGYGIPGPGYQ